MDRSRTALIFSGRFPVNPFEAEWMAGEYGSSLSPIVIGGCARSGTTLMRIILDSHSQICCGPESRLFEAKPIIISYLSEQFDILESDILKIYRDVHSRVEFIERLAKYYSMRTAKSRWAEKTAKNVRNLVFIFRAFPNARYINLIRDGRDVVCSLRMHPKEMVKNGKIVPTGIVNPIEMCIRRWISDVNTSREFWEDSRFLMVKYEDLVNAKEKCLRRVLDFVGEHWDPNVLDHTKISSPSRSAHKLVTNQNAVQPVSNISISRWRRDLKEDERLLFKRLAGDLLIELGYANSYDW